MWEIIPSSFPVGAVKERGASMHKSHQVCDLPLNAWHYKTQVLLPCLRVQYLYAEELPS